MAASSNSAGSSPSAKGKEREQDPVWDGFMFEVPGFHDEIFWECKLDRIDGQDMQLTIVGKDVITVSEMQILKRLGFNMQVRVLGDALLGCSATDARIGGPAV